MKKICLMTLALVALMITGCKKEHSKEALLGMMPDDVVMAAVGDMEDVLESFGCDINENKVKIPGVISSLATDSDMKNLLGLLEDGDTGIEMSYFGMFMTKDTGIYIVGYLYDADKFMAFAEKETKKSFSKENGLNCIKEDEGYIIVDGDMFWLAFAKGSNALDHVKIYMDLEKDKSLAGGKLGETLLTSDGDLMALVNMKNLNRIASVFGDRDFEEVLTGFMQGASVTFDDFTYIMANVDLKDNSLEATMRLLNSQGTDAKSSTPLGSIDPATIKYAGVSNANILAAIAFSPATIKQFCNTMQSSGAPADAINMVMGLSGTIAFIAADPQSMTAVIDYSSVQSDNDIKLAMTTMIGGVMTRSGDKLVWAMDPNKDFKGGLLSVDKMADKFKGQFMGLAVSNIGGIITRGHASSSDLTYVTVGDKDGVVEVKITSVFKDGKHYFLSLIEEAVKINMAMSMQDTWSDSSLETQSVENVEVVAQEPTQQSKPSVAIPGDIDMSDLSPAEQQMVRDIVGDVTDKVLSGQM